MGNALGHGIHDPANAAVVYAGKVAGGIATAAPTCATNESTSQRCGGQPPKSDRVATKGETAIYLVFCIHHY